MNPVKNLFRSARNAEALQKVSDTAILVGLPEAEFERLERSGSERAIAAGAGLIYHATEGREVLLVLSGVLSVERNGLELATLSSGDIVGEMALITDSTRNASVTAATDASVVVYQEREFASLMKNCPELESRLRRITFERLLGNQD